MSEIITFDKKKISILTRLLMNAYIPFVRVFLKKDLKEYGFKDRSSVWRFFLFSWNIGHFLLIKSEDLRSRVIEEVSQKISSISWPKRSQVVKDLFDKTLGKRIEYDRETARLDAYRLRWELITSYREIANTIITKNLKGYLHGMSKALDAASQDSVRGVLRFYREAFHHPQFYVLHNLSFLLTLTYYKDPGNIISRYLETVSLFSEFIFRRNIKLTFKSLKEAYEEWFGYKSRHGEQIRAFLTLLVGSSCVLPSFDDSGSITLKPLLNLLSLTRLNELLVNKEIDKGVLLDAFIECILSHFPLSYILEKSDERFKIFSILLIDYVKELLDMVRSKGLPDELVLEALRNECSMLEKMALNVTWPDTLNKYEIDKIITKWLRKYMDKVDKEVKKRKIDIGRDIVENLLKLLALNNILQVGTRVPLTSEEYFGIIRERGFLCGLLDKPFIYTYRLRSRVIRENISLEMPYILVRAPEAYYAIAYILK